MVLLPDYRVRRAVPVDTHAACRTSRATTNRHQCALYPNSSLCPPTPHSMGMLLGFDDTILGVGAPEVFIILAVGYFVLGPVELFKLTKQAGVLVGQLRDLGLGTVTNLGNIMDEQVLRLVLFLVKLCYIPGTW